MENVAAMGVPIPKILLQALDIMRSKGDGTIGLQSGKTPATEAAGEDKKNDDDKPPAEG